MDSRPDALIHKARIAIQIQPSGRQSAWSERAFNRYGNCVFNFNRSDACLSWFGRSLNRYRNCVLKINRLDSHPPWFERAKPYMKITCSRRATVRTTVPHRHGSQIGKIFSENLRILCRTVVHPDGPCPLSGQPPYLSQQSPI